MLMADVVVSGKPKNTKKLAFIFIAIFCVFLIFLVTFAFINSHNNTRDKNKAKAVARQNYINKQSVLNNRLKSTSNNEDRTNIYFEQVSEALKAGKVVDAENYAKSIKNSTNSSQSYNVAMAYISEAKKDKKQAISYWQQAINSLDSNLEEYNLIKNDYQININRLRE